MNKTMWILAFSLVGLSLIGCVRDTLPDCPPLRVTLTVKDKNYFNIDAAVRQGMAQKVDENLPFREYVSTVYYALYNEAGELVVEQTNYAVQGSATEEVITLPSDLPYGKYSISVWGNMKSDRPLGGDAHTAEMEHADAAKNDIYTVTGEIDYRYGNENYTLELQRTKGALLIKAENLPDRIDFSAKKITNVYSVVTSDLQYAEPVDLLGTTEWGTVQNDILTKTLYCPSSGFEQSTLTVAFGTHSESRADGEAIPMLMPDEVNVTMGRNELTIMKYVYNPEGSGDNFDVYILINDNWEMNHGMDID